MSILASSVATLLMSGVFSAMACSTWRSSTVGWVPLFLVSPSWW